jgi:uncharacterized membrane protein YccC
MKNFLKNISEVNKNTKTSQKITDFVFGALISAALYFAYYVFFMGFLYNNIMLFFIGFFVIFSPIFIFYFKKKRFFVIFGMILMFLFQIF